MSVKKYTDATGVAEIWAKVKSIIPSKTSDLTNDSSFITPSGILDMFYPVGSYYETSDTNFDPNTSWGGVWVLETAGIVHVSAGAGWVVNGAPTNTKDGGNKDAIVPYHTHSYTKPPASTDGFALKVTHLPAHTHGKETLTGTASIHSDVGVLGANASLSGIFEKGASVSTSYRPNWTSGASYKLKVDASHTHNSVGDGTAHSHPLTNTSASVGYPSGTSSGNTTGANMPPYIKVNRWHRMPDDYVAS